MQNSQRVLLAKPRTAPRRGGAMGTSRPTAKPRESCAGVMVGHEVARGCSGAMRGGSAVGMGEEGMRENADVSCVNMPIILVSFRLI